MSDFPHSGPPAKRELQAITESSAVSENAVGMPTISEQWTLAWEEFGRRYPRLKHGPAIVAFFVFTFLGLSVLGVITYFYVFLPWFVWLLMFLSTTVLAQMFVINFAGKAHQRRLAEIGVHMASGLVIDYRPEESVFVQTYGPVTQYRVGVRSVREVSGVELVVNHLRVQDFPPYLNLHLRPMHDRDTISGTKRVKLHAKKENYWDLITKFEAEAMESRRPVVALNCIPALGKIDLEPGYYEFELMATGDNNPEATKIVRLTIRNDGSVTLDLRDGRLSS
jgi:hypothetical protein